jgi:hypothetical protein
MSTFNFETFTNLMKQSPKKAFAYRDKNTKIVFAYRDKNTKIV